MLRTGLTSGGLPMFKRLTGVVFFVWILAGCGERSREVKSLQPAPDTLQADVRKDTPVTLPKVSKVVPTVADDTPDYCHQLIHSLIDKSSFEPEMKKLGYGVWVDTVYHGMKSVCSLNTGSGVRYSIFL